MTKRSWSINSCPDRRSSRLCYKRVKRNHQLKYRSHLQFIIWEGCINSGNIVFQLASWRRRVSKRSTPSLHGRLGCCGSSKRMSRGLLCIIAATQFVLQVSIEHLRFNSWPIMNTKQGSWVENRFLWCFCWCVVVQCSKNPYRPFSAVNEHVFSRPTKRAKLVHARNL